MVTSRDVAKLAGVSQPTVSRALRGDSRIAEATRERVQTAARALGYSPDPIGRALSVGHSTRVGLVVTDLRNQFYSHLIAPMHDELEKLGYELVLVTESSEGAQVADHIVANGLCGAVLATTTIDSVVPVRLRDRGVPFVYFNRVAASVMADSVTTDPEPGMRELVDALVGHGHRTVGALFGPRNTSTGQQREEVLRSLLEEHEIVLPSRLTRYGAFDGEAGHAGCRELMAAKNPPTAIVCANDVVAFGALNGAAELGLDVPGDVSIVGFDDLPLSRWPLLDLTTVAYDIEELSRAAARQIVSRVTGGADAPPRHEVLTSRLVVRGTLGLAPRG
ncbi:LacI family DNA-binding transcriptional regulator [Knoellia sp. CPCC 206453]|uniref:LacI family DNA-binding transcriptional regulator n=1 Tax=Knoellia pratensis TaxID=3404796 RepID=UPI003614AEA6